MLKRLTRDTFIIILFLTAVLRLSGIKNLFAAETASADHMVINTLHFRIFHRDNMSASAIYAAEKGEESYLYLANYFKHELSNTVQIFLNGTIPAKNGVSVEGLSKYSTGNLEISFNGDNLSFHHELTYQLARVFQNEIINGSTGTGIYYSTLSSTEFILKSMAAYLSEGYTENQEMIIRDILTSGKSRGITDITSAGSSGYGLLPAAIGRSFFFFLESVYGKDIISEILFNIKYNNNIYKAIEISAGKMIKEINAEWIAFYKDRNKAWLDKDSETREHITDPLEPGSENNSLRMLRKYSFAKDELSQYPTDITGFDNYPSFTNDFKSAAYTAKPESREILIIETATQKILKRIKLPFLKIKDVSISNDGSALLFIGCSYNSSDIYIYDAGNGSISRITNDSFNKRFPVISPGKDFIIFSSNENNEKDTGSGIYKLIKIDLRSQEKAVLVDNKKINLHPDISYDGGKILYISNLSGIYNLYMLDTELKKNIQLTDVSTGVFFPRWISRDNMAYIIYNGSFYKLFSKSIDEMPSITGQNVKPSAYKIIKYPEPYFEIKDAVLTRQGDEGNTGVSSAVSADFSDAGFAGSIRVTAGGFPGNYRLIFSADYAGYDYKIGDDAGFNLDFEYLKYRIFFGSGIFYRSNPLQSLAADDGSGALTLYTNNINSTSYGLSLFAGYPFTEKSYVNIKLSHETYENLHDKKGRKEIHPDILSLSFRYDSIGDNILPSSGTISGFALNHFFSVADDNFSLNSVSFGFIKYFRFNRIIFSAEGGAGKLSGNNTEYFDFYTSGSDRGIFNKIIGHEYSDYSGNNAFSVSMELRLIIAERFKIFTAYFNEISMVLFSDAGSAWDNDYNLINKNGELEDLKSGIGTGLRFFACGHTLFKLDVAWPYYYKSFGEREISAGFDFRY